MNTGQTLDLNGQLVAAVRDPVLLRAGAALASNDLATAERVLKQRLLETPFNVAAIRMLAEVAARVGRPAEAERLLRRALELTPDFGAARLNLAIVLQRTNRFEEAHTEVERVLAHDPDNKGAMALLGATAARLGRFEEAIGAYERILERFPDQPRLWISLGHVLKTVGRRQDAIGAYRRAIGQAPTLGEAWWSLANLKTVEFTSADVTTMEEALTHAPTRENRYHLHFALGKAFEDSYDDSGAFDHYCAANRLRREDLLYDANELTVRVARIHSTLTRQVFETRRGAGFASAEPIFIVGVPRSGSTLVEQILASHRLVEGTAELPDLLAIADELAGRNPGGPSTGEHSTSTYIDRLLTLSSEELARLGRSYLDRTRAQRRTERPFFIDKMPNNFVHVGLIHMILPHAKIIDARRHPMATGFSCFKQHFASGQEFTYDLEDLGRYWRDYEALMDHYDAVLPGRVHRVLHEQLVESPEREVRALLHYCGLEFEAACLEFHRTERAIRTASSEQVRQPLTRASLGQWRRFEPKLETLQRALGDSVSRYEASLSSAAAW